MLLFYIVKIFNHQDQFIHEQLLHPYYYLLLLKASDSELDEKRNYP